ncbi:MAG: TadE/TadG family type IV pilus assembly protein [Desulfobaccales bacterium]
MRLRGPRIFRRRGEQGNITIEMALAMPVFLLMVAGVFDLGMLFWEKHVLTNAAREGARAATKAVDNGTGITADMTQTEVKQVVQNYLNKFALKNLDGSSLVLNSSNFSYTWTTTSSGTILTINLNNIPCQLLLLPSAKTLVGGSRTPGDDVIYLDAQTSMAAEWSTPPSP